MLMEGVSLPFFRSLGNWEKAVKNLGASCLFLAELEGSSSVSG